MRQGQVILKGGYDGEFGQVLLFDPAEKETLAGQDALFGISTAKKRLVGKNASINPLNASRITRTRMSEKRNPR